MTGSDGGSTATSVVEVPRSGIPVLRVTHDFKPSQNTQNLYEITITIDNLSGADMNSVIYRRVMDWDIFPTASKEFVTIQGTTTTTKLVKSGNNGFLSAEPCSSTGAVSGYHVDLTAGKVLPNTEDVDFVDAGPDDMGSVFDFEVGPIPAGGSTSITIFYGSAPTEAEALLAVSSVGAELYSLGQSNTLGGSTLGTPATFIFAFDNGIGGLGDKCGITPTPAELFCDGMTIDQLIASGSYHLIDNRGKSSKSLEGTKKSDLILIGDKGVKVEAKDGNDCIIGGAGNDKIDGGKDDDQIFGLDGNDEIRGGKGDDILNGGAGNDLCNDRKGNNVIDIATCEKIKQKVEEDDDSDDERENDSDDDEDDRDDDDEDDD